MLFLEVSGQFVRGQSRAGSAIREVVRLECVLRRRVESGLTLALTAPFGVVAGEDVARSPSRGLEASVAFAATKGRCSCIVFSEVGLELRSHLDLLASLGA